MMFSSKAHVDETPYVWPSGVRSMFSRGDGIKLTYAPRTGINPQNWLLKAFREEAKWELDTYDFVGWEEKSKVIPELAQKWLDNIITYASEYGVESLDEVNHAYRVLSRLARLEEKND